MPPQRITIGAYEAKNFSATLALSTSRITRWDIPKKFEILDDGEISPGSYILIASAKSKTYLRSLDCKDGGILTPLRLCTQSSEIPEGADLLRCLGSGKYGLWIFQTPQSLFSCGCTKKGREALHLFEEAFLLYVDKHGAPDGFERSFERFAKLRELATRPGYIGEGEAAFRKARQVAIGALQHLLKN